MEFRDILILVNVTATDKVYPTLIQHARAHRWRLTIEDRMAPPRGWRGDGAIVQAMDWPVIARYVSGLRRRGIPVVNLVNSKIDCAIPSCVTDNCAAARMVAGHFLECGFTHSVYFAMEWLSGRDAPFATFARAMRGCDVQRWAWPLEAGERLVNNREALVKWIKGKLRAAPKPISVLCPNAYNAVTFLNVCLDMGLAVPDEIAIACDAYDPAFCDCQAVPISGVEYDDCRQAREAAALLDRLIDGDASGPTRIVIPPTRLVVQQSTDVLATENHLMRQAFRFIRENLSRPFGAAEVAAHLGIPRVRLDRLFAAELSRSVGAEIMRQRLAKAKKLLEETPAPLKSIAAETGFCHAAYLIRSFRRAFGTTPGKYRSQAAAKRV